MGLGSGRRGQRPAVWKGRQDRDEGDCGSGSRDEIAGKARDARHVPMEPRGIQRRPRTARRPVGQHEDARIAALVEQEVFDTVEVMVRRRRDREEERGEIDAEGLPDRDAKHGSHPTPAVRRPGRRRGARTSRIYLRAPLPLDRRSRLGARVVELRPDRDPLDAPRSPLPAPDIPFRPRPPDRRPTLPFLRGARRNRHAVLEVPDRRRGDRRSRPRARVRGEPQLLHRRLPRRAPAVGDEVALEEVDLLDPAPRLAAPHGG